MGAFDCLPKVDACCFFIPLKWGCVIISICGILSLGTVTHMVGGYYHGSNIRQILEIFSYISMAAQVIFGICSIILLIGILMEKSEPIQWWLIACALYVIVMLIYAVLGCPLFYKSGGSWGATAVFLITPAIWIYFMCVVNSYE